MSRDFLRFCVSAKPGLSKPGAENCLTEAIVLSQTVPAGRQLPHNTKGNQADSKKGKFPYLQGPTWPLLSAIPTTFNGIETRQ